MIRQFATIANGVVDNIILIDEEEIELINSLGAIPIPDNMLVCIGWQYVDGAFIDPNPPRESVTETLTPLTDEEIALMLQELQNEITTAP